MILVWRMSDVPPIVIDKTPPVAFIDGIGSLATLYPRGTHLSLHRHDTAQLLFAAAGTMQVTTPTGRWLVPPHRAVWLPPRFAHAVDMLSDVAMRSTYIEDRVLPGMGKTSLPASDRVIVVSPLLRALILALFEPEVARPRRRMVVALLLDEVAASLPAPTFVPMPRSPAMTRLAEAALADPACRQNLGALAVRAGISVRTASRLFPAETTLTFKSWRQRVRVMAALEQLSAGGSVKEVAARLGFSSSAAFSAAFRAVMGQAPSAASRIGAP